MKWQSALIMIAMLLAILTPEIVRRVHKSSRPSINLDKLARDAEQRAKTTGEDPTSTPSFRDVTNEWKLDFVAAVGPPGTYFVPEINGSGGALFDYDNDGDLDLYLINNGPSPKTTEAFAEDVRSENRLFRQEEDGTFTDVTSGSGLGAKDYGIGCIVGDINNDGHPDVFVSNYGRDRIFQNKGDGTFTDITEAAGIDNPEWGTCAAFFDYDRDGWLDLVVANYTADPKYGHTVACGFLEGRVSYCGPHKFDDTIDRLYHNDGPQTDANGNSFVHFTDVTESAGLTKAASAGFGVVCADFTGDRWPDFFIGSDMRPNRLWVNGQDGTFREEAVIRGVAASGQGLALGSMGVAIGDSDNDGDLDLAVTTLITEGARLFRNEGRGQFVDAARVVHLDALTWQHTGWGAGFIDLDHDGDLDLPIANGFVVPGRSSFPPHGEDTYQLRHDKIRDPDAFWLEYADENLLMMNDGEGNFARRNGGDFTKAIGSARALIYGDIDDDGDIDMVVTNVGSRAKIYRNEFANKGHWLMLRCIDPRYKRDAYGAEVVVRAGGHEQLRLLSPAASYLASNDVRLHYGLAAQKDYEEVIVRWPDGLDERFPGGSADRLVTLERGSGQAIEKSAE